MKRTTTRRTEDGIGEDAYSQCGDISGGAAASEQSDCLSRDAGRQSKNAAGWLENRIYVACRVTV